MKTLVFVYSIYLASLYLEPALLGMVLLFRRQGGVWASALNLGLSQSILKYRSSASEEQGNGEYYTASIDICLLVSCVFLVASSLFLDSMSKELFSTSDSEIAFYFSIYVVGIMFNYLAYSSWLSILKFPIANSVELFSLGFTFIVAIVIFRVTGSEILFWKILSISCITISVSFLLLFIVRENPSYFLFSLKRFKNIASKLVVLKFGLPRGLSAFLDGVLYTIGPWLLLNDKKETGFMILSLSIIKLLQTAITPVAQVISLRVINSDKGILGEQRRLLLILSISILMAFSGIAFYLLFKNEILGLWLGDNAVFVMFYLDELIYFMPALAGFYLFRNYVDLHYRFPYTTVFLIVWFIVFYLSYESLTLDALTDKELVLTSMKNSMYVFYIYLSSCSFYLIQEIRRKA